MKEHLNTLASECSGGHTGSAEARQIILSWRAQNAGATTLIGTVIYGSRLAKLVCFAAFISFSLCIPLKAVEHVAWGGVSFKGEYKDRSSLFPYTSRQSVLDALQETLTRCLQTVTNASCALLIGKQFNFSRGDRLVASCVLESEDITLAQHENKRFGQVTIAASLIVFDFQDRIIVSSSPLGAIYEISAMPGSEPLPDSQIESLVRKTLVGSEELASSLASQAAIKYANLPVRLKGNFRNLQVVPAAFDDQTALALNIHDDLARSLWRNYFANRIGDSLSEKFGINIVPTTDGEGAISTMTISFADKSRLPDSISGEQTLTVNPPSVIAEAKFSQAGNYVIKSASNSSQVAKTFGCVASVNFTENGKIKFNTKWGYGINRVFKPEHADDQTPEQLSLYYRAAIENGFAKNFMALNANNLTWLSLAETLKK